MLALDGIEFPVHLTIHLEELLEELVREVHADPEDSLRVSVFKD